MRKISILLFLAAASCAHQGFVFRSVHGFSPATNAALEKFLEENKSHKGRKVAVFDGDGTVLGQVPHYLADECLYRHAKAHPDRRPEIIARMKHKSNVSIPYVQDRVFYLAGMTLDEVRQMGTQCYESDYRGKIYTPMKDLIELLKDNDFEIWIITASPEGLYQEFLSHELQVSPTHIVGVKSVIRGGIITDRIVEPIPQDAGKKEAVETFVQTTPLLAAGNSRGDREMIESSSGIRMIINPDEHLESGEKISIAQYAKDHNWLIEKINDVEESGFPAVSSKSYGIRKNRAHPVP